MYSPTKYAELIEHIQSQLTEEEWKKYKEGHDDLIKIYKELNENSNTIIWGIEIQVIWKSIGADVNFAIG